jgi:hypothetical protein
MYPINETSNEIDVNFTQVVAKEEIAQGLTAEVYNF